MNCEYIWYGLAAGLLSSLVFGFISAW